MSQKLAEFQPFVQRGSDAAVRDREFVQLIPLFGTARDPVALRPWPQVTCKAVHARLSGPLDERTERLTKSLVRRSFRMLGLRDSRLRNRVIRNVAAKKIREAVRDKAMAAICDDLKKRGLCPP